MTNFSVNVADFKSSGSSKTDWLNRKAAAANARLQANATAAAGAEVAGALFSRR